FVPGTTTADSSLNATVEIRLYTNAGCSGFITGGSQGQVLASGIGSAWYTVTDDNFLPPGGLPVTVGSAQVYAFVRQTGNPAPSQTDYQVNFDHFHLFVNSTTPVGLLQFDVE